MRAEVEFFGNWVRVEKPWRSRGENRIETVEFERAIKRVFEVVAETVIFNCY